ncbi:hypothetical protein STAS_28519 [Striga asiatica]|uniref:Uncharacterized protein n=1 Tax=Striga asiatica TaxID=4170 RepID=A0A5A7R0F7_STRAF|nr:hypothetical protein STAS_28519 [Striga asiatica]
MESTNITKKERKKERIAKIEPRSGHGQQQYAKPSCDRKPCNDEQKPNPFPILPRRIMLCTSFTRWWCTSGLRDAPPLEVGGWTGSQQHQANVYLTKISPRFSTTILHDTKEGSTLHKVNKATLQG